MIPTFIVAHIILAVQLMGWGGGSCCGEHGAGGLCCADKIRDVSYTCKTGCCYATYGVKGVVTSIHVDTWFVLRDTWGGVQ